jgi:hypothetical protein
VPHPIGPARKRACALAVLFLSLAQLASAQRPADSASARSSHDVPVPSATAVPRSGPISIDGHIDEEAWSRATPITEFTQVDPDEGKPATQRTEVRFLYDEDALYVSARMFESRGSSAITTRLVRRDADMESDWFQVVIDGYHDHLGRAFFQVNPSGVKFDALGVGGSNPDDSWDPIWQVATSIDAQGWSGRCRRGACRFAASSSALRSRISGRSGRRPKSADRRASAISKDFASPAYRGISRSCPMSSDARDS